MDPLHYMTIAAHSFDTIKFVSCPLWQSYSADSILWMGWIMKEEGIFIQHTENHSKRRIEIKEDGMSYLKNMDGV